MRNAISSGVLERCAMRTALLFALVILCLGTARAQDVAAIRGQVRDTAGAPLIGALVVVQSADTALRERLVVTDRDGTFSVEDLLAGRYLVKVSKSSFLPAVAAGVDLVAGTDAILTVNLQTALDVVRRGIRRGDLEDMKWVLRSSPSARPIMRHAEDEASEREDLDQSMGAPEASGYFQLYSSSVETSKGVADSVGSQFSVTLPLSAEARVTFAGQYTEAEDQPSGFGATYEFSSGNRKRSALALKMRQGAIVNGVLGPEQREIKVEYGEQLQWSDRLVFSYGADFGRAVATDGYNYVRPEVATSWVPDAQTVMHAAYSRRAPTDTSDPVRGREYFDRAFYVPPDQERYSHTEIGVTRTLSDFVRASAALFRDELATQAFLVDADDGRRAIMVFNGRNAPTSGIRLEIDRLFRDFEAGVSYAFASAVGFDDDIVSPDDLWREASRRHLHVVTARFKADIELSHTAVTAVYRWTSGASLAPIDPYQQFAEFNDPTLSITVAQDLPSMGVVPGRFQAVVDARNLFESSFGSRRTVHASYPRLLKGGIHIKF